MKRILWRFAVVVTVLAACGPGPPNADVDERPEAFDTASPARDSASVIAFVQSFYDWYVPVADTSRGPAIWTVLTSRSDDLDAGIRDALRADSAFGERGDGTGTREPLNFDPLLASQDPCTRYHVTEAREVSGEYHVAVKAVCADSTWQTARPIVVVGYMDGRWNITNIVYEETDLRSLLCAHARRDLRAENRDRGCPAR